MRTSNKLLIGFFALVFATPILMGLALKSKVKGGDYYIIDNTSFGPLVNKKLAKQPHTVILKGQPGYAECSIIWSDQPAYGLNFGNEDGFTVTEKEDTLEINFKNQSANTGESHKTKISLYLTALPDLYAQGVEISVEENQAINAANWNVSLADSSSIRIAGAYKKDADRIAGVGAVSVQRLLIRASNSQVYLGANMAAQNLQIQTENSSLLHIVPSARIDSISGSIDVSTDISSSGKNILALSKLITQ